MGAYLAGASNPSLLREYDRKRSQQASENDAPKRRNDETESEFSNRVRKYQTVANALARL